MDIGILRIVVALVGTAAAAYFDVFNKKNVPETLLYSFLAVALIINALDYGAFIQNLPIAVVIIGAMYFMYRLGQLGGADVIVLAAIYASIPMITTPLLSVGSMQQLPVELQFPSILIVTSVSVILFALWVLVRYIPPAIKRTFRGEIKFNAMQLGEAGVLVVSFGAFIYLFAQLPMFPSDLIAIMAVLFISAIFFALYKNAILESMVVWKRKPENEDVLAIELVDNRTVNKYSIGRLVDEKQLKRMSKLKRKWPVLDLPMFLPFILAALVIYILLGSQILYGLI